MGEDLVHTVAGHDPASSRIEARPESSRDLFGARKPPLAISLWQPHASLWIVSPRVKWNETRHWSFPRRYLGMRCLVHAAKTTEGIRDAAEDEPLAELCSRLFGAGWATTLPRGGFIGDTTLAECERMGQRVGKTPDDFLCGYWAPHRYAWLGEEPRSFPLIPARGQQGFWTVDPALLDDGGEAVQREPVSANGMNQDALSDAPVKETSHG